MKVTNDMISHELESTERAIELEKYKTALKKTQFIGELKNGLGDEIKVAPSAIRFIKKTWSQKLKIFFSKLFTKF